MSCGSLKSFDYRTLPLEEQVEYLENQVRQLESWQNLRWQMQMQNNWRQPRPVIIIKKQ